MIGPREVGEAIVRAADLAGIGVTVIDPASGGGERVFVSDGAVELLGYSREELERIPVLSTIAPRARAAAEAALAEWRAAQKRSGVFPTVVVRKDGRELPVEAAFSSIDLDGRTLAVTFLFDLTRREDAARALRESDARFRSLIENAPDGVGIIQDGHFAYANSRALAIFGYESVEELKTVSLGQLFETSDVALMGARIREMLERGTTFPPYVYTVIRKDGAQLQVEVTSFGIRHEDRPAVVGFARDVTDRTRLAAQLAQADRLVAIGTLAAGVAHEINNPMTFMYLRIEALERWAQQLPEAQRQDLSAQLTDLKGGADRVARIVRDLRMFSRSAEQPRGPVDLGAVFGFVERITGSEARRRAQIVVQTADVPPVLGDPGRLEQVFLNLVLNAMQAMADDDPERNRVVMSARLDGARVRVDVEDNGAGMTAEVAARIFDPFFTTKPVGVGTGLGLSICHGIITQLGGEISVESTPGTGTRFHVWLPIYAGD